MRRSGPADGGFTLIELMLVASLFGLLTLMAAPLFRGALGTLAVEDAAWSLARTLDYARERSIIERRPHRVLLDLRGSAYGVERMEDGAFRPLSGRFRRRRPAHGVRFEAERTDFPFRPDGAGVDGRIAVVGAGDRIELELDGFTGDVQVEDPHEG